MGKRYDRVNQVISILKEKNGATVKELAEIFDVSEMTIRRDLALLKTKNIINNAHGAAIYNPNNTTEAIEQDYSLYHAHITMGAEKRKIGQMAASLIQTDDIIIIDTGSTTEELALAIHPELQASIFCYNLNIMNILADKKNIRLACAGGYYHPNTQMLESPDGIAFIRSMRATKAFLSAAGIHKHLGITCATNYESPTKQAVIESSAEKILLADSSKFNEVKSSFFAKLTDFDMIITDSSLSQDWRDLIEEQNIRLILV